MEMTIGAWVALVLGLGPLAGWLLWWWNDLRYTLPIKMRLRWFSSGATTRLPPGHMGLPFLGETLNFLWYFKTISRPDDYINSKRKKYGEEVGMYRTHLFGSPAIVSCSPVINKFVFRSESDFIMEWPNLDIVGNDSLSSVQGEAHARLRNFIARAVNQPDALRRIAPMVQPRLIEALRSWAQKGRVVGFKEAKLVTFENIGKLFAGLDPGPVLDTLEELFQGLIHGIRSNPINIPGTTYHHALQCRKKAVAIFKEELEKRKKRNYNYQEEVIDHNGDLLDGLMKMKDEEGKQLSENEILDNIVNLIIAGYETTSLAMTWALYFLAKYPNVLQKLREENMALSKKKNGEVITVDDISTLTYTSRVVEETIRTGNIAAMVFRTVTKDVDYKGYRIPKGWKMILWVRYLHTDAQNFDDPMCFNPDRWNESVKPAAYQPFGGGSRICVGNMFARLQIAIFLHYLVVGYKWELVNPNAEIQYLSHPKPADGVEINFSKT